jgi:hypothetical protein
MTRSSTGSSLDSFLDVQNQVLQKMVQFNVRLKPSKCCFGIEEIEFLGNQWSRDQNELAKGSGYQSSSRANFSEGIPQFYKYGQLV